MPDDVGAAPRVSRRCDTARAGPIEYQSTGTNQTKHPSTGIMLLRDQDNCGGRQVGAGSDAQCMKETAGNRWCSTCRFRPPVKKLPTAPPQLADVSTCMSHAPCESAPPRKSSCAQL